MAMIDCPECSHRISDQSNSCPNCGFVTNKNYSANQQRKKGGCSGMMIFFIIILIAIGSFVMSSYVSYKEKTEQYRQVQESVEPSTDITYIPMSDSNENGRYFLTSHTTDNGIEYIEYVRRGNDNTSHAKMQIKCSSNKIKKYSADNLEALKSADMGSWYTPEWTDKDIVNFICS